MALDDISTDRYCWYDAAYLNMIDYNETTSVDFGKGKQNTEKMIKYWNQKKYGEQNTGYYKDMWGAIQGEVAKDGLVRLCRLHSLEGGNPSWKYFSRIIQYRVLGRL